MNRKPLPQGTYIPNIKVISEMVQKLKIKMLLWQRKILKSGITSPNIDGSQNVLYKWEAPITRYLNTKYEGFI